MARKKRRMSAKARAAALRNLAKARRARGGGKRRRRRTVRLSNSAPRRRRYSMRRKRGGGRRKGIKVTPLRIAKAVTVLAGAKMILLNDNSALDLARWHISNPQNFKLSDPNLYKEYGKRILPGAVVAIVGPKLLEKGVQLFSKGEPAIGRVARVKLITV